MICEDERQYVNLDGQTWTTMDELKDEHRNVLKTLEPGLTEILTEPKVGIGQRALLVQTPKGNVLWDCISLIDDETVSAIEALGGVAFLAMSHPHMHGSLVEWSHAFGNAPIRLHESVKQWVARPDPAIEYWSGDSLSLNEFVTLHRTGGHFTGSTLLQWSTGAEGRGVLLTSDTMHVVWDLKHVTFMRSYPNYIPLPAETVDQIARAVEPLKFDRIYSHFAGLVIDKDAKGAVRRSADRYKAAIGAGAGVLAV
jgi:glyoxylase-like metal-dependent hydrolase (beta-lactamase superfamily II)